MQIRVKCVEEKWHKLKPSGSSLVPDNAIPKFHT